MIKILIIKLTVTHAHDVFPSGLFFYLFIYLGRINLGLFLERPQAKEKFSYESSV